MKLIEPYKKVKYLRNKYDLKQSDFHSLQINQAKLSEIENGKLFLSDYYTKCIINKFNFLLNKKKIKKKIPLKALNYDIYNIAKKIAKNYIKIFKKSSNIKQLKKMARYSLNIINYLNVNDKIRYFKEIGDAFYRNEKYYFAKHYYMKIFILHDYNYPDLLSKVLLNLMRILWFTESYKSELIFDLEYYFKNIEDKTNNRNLEIIYLNFGIIYANLDNYEKALSFIKNSEDNIKKTKFNLARDILKAKCYTNLNRFDEAKAILKKLIRSKESNEENKIWAHFVLLDIYDKENDIEKLKNCLYYLKKNVEDGNLIYLRKRYKILGDISLKLNRKKDFLSYYKKAIYIDRIQENEDYDISLQYEIIETILKTMTKKDYDEVKKLEKKYFSLVSINYNATISGAFYKYYIKNDFIEDYENHENFIEKEILNKIKEI